MTVNEHTFHTQVTHLPLPCNVCCWGAHSHLTCNRTHLLTWKLPSPAHASKVNQSSFLPGHSEKHTLRPMSLSVCRDLAASSFHSQPHPLLHCSISKMWAHGMHPAGRTVQLCSTLDTRRVSSCGKIQLKLRALLP